MLDKLIKEMQEKGLISVAPLKFIGKAKPVFEMITLMATTDPEETDPNWWATKLYLRRN